MLLTRFAGPNRFHFVMLGFRMKGHALVTPTGFNAFQWTLSR